MYGSAFSFFGFFYFFIFELNFSFGFSIAGTNEVRRCIQRFWTLGTLCPRGPQTRLWPKEASSGALGPQGPRMEPRAPGPPHEPPNEPPLPPPGPSPAQPQPRLVSATPGLRVGRNGFRSMWEWPAPEGPPRPPGHPHGLLGTPRHPQGSPRPPPRRAG